MPGDGGSQMEAMLDKPSVVHYICSKKTDYWFDLWLNMELLMPEIIDCWVSGCGWLLLHSWPREILRKEISQKPIILSVPCAAD